MQPLVSASTGRGAVPKKYFCQQITFVKRRFYGIRLKWAHKESSINKVCGDYGLPKFWGEYIRKRGRFDNKIKLDPVGSTVRLTYEVKKLCNGWYLAVLSHNIAI